MNGAALRERGLALGSRIARQLRRALDVRHVHRHGSSAGAGRAPIERLPYFAEMAAAELAGVRHLVLVGAQAPVAFFAYPGKPN